MTRVKICGCRTPEDALAAAEAGADFIGLIFAESRRRVSVEEAAEIVRALGPRLAEQEMTSPPALFRTDAADSRSWFERGAGALERMLARKRPLTVGVFADADPEEIDETADEAGIDLIQLSGGEPWGACLLANRQVIKVVHVVEGDTAGQVLGRIETGSAIAVMLDRGDRGTIRKQPESGSPYGGGGLTFDWGIATVVATEMPLWLAGGLTPENVAVAIAAVRPWCVDVSSGVETEGMKDGAKIRTFIKHAQVIAS